MPPGSGASLAAPNEGVLSLEALSALAQPPSRNDDPLPDTSASALLPRHKEVLPARGISLQTGTAGGEERAGLQAVLTKCVLEHQTSSLQRQPAEVEENEEDCVEDVDFESMAQVRQMMQEFAAKSGRPLRILRSKPDAYTVACWDAECPFHLSAAGGERGRCRVQRWVMKHMCERALDRDSDPRNSQEFLTRTLGPLLARNPDVTAARAKRHLARHHCSNPRHSQLLRALASARAAMAPGRSAGEGSAPEVAGHAEDSQGGAATCYDFDSDEDDSEEDGDDELGDGVTRIEEDYVLNLYFDSMKDVKELVRKHSSRVDRPLRHVRTQSDRYIVGCWDEQCPFYLVAVKEQSGKVCVRTWNKRHRCKEKLNRRKDLRNREKFLVEKLLPLVARDPAVKKRRARTYLFKHHGSTPRMQQLFLALAIAKAVRRGQKNKSGDCADDSRGGGVRGQVGTSS